MENCVTENLHSAIAGSENDGVPSLEAREKCDKPSTVAGSELTVADDQHSSRPQDQRSEGHLVQIQASNAEIMRRITALIEQKQREVDENNRQEFCSVHPAMEGDIEGKCARTSAVFVPRSGGKSHIKVSRVVNIYGPQTRMLSGGSGALLVDRDVNQDVSGMPGIEERLANMEDHLKLPGRGQAGVYSRLKELEERILFLESLSPEYFTTGPPPKKQRKQEKQSSSEISVQELDVRMAQLRESLLCRKMET